MKKKLLPLVMLMVVAGFAVAQEEVEGAGLTAGIGFSFGNALEETVITAIPQATYSNTFGPVGVYLQLDVCYSFLHIFYRSTDAFEGILEPPQRVYLEEELACNFFRASSALFTFTLNNKNSIITYPSDDTYPLPRKFSDYMGRRFSGEVDPSFTCTLDVLSDEMFGTVGFPVTYALSNLKTDPLIGTYLTVGYKSLLGLGIAVTGHVNLHSDPGYAGTEYLFYCKNEKLYFEVKVLTDKKLTAFTLIPMIEGTLKKFILGGEMEISNRNSATRHTTLISTIRVKYRF